MQVLAGVAAKDEYYSMGNFIIGFYYAPQYSAPANAMKKIKPAGLEDPHYVDAYIILCENGD